VSLQFAPLVFSRTKEVDFRCLVVPEDFSGEDMEWSTKHILATLLNSVELSENPRWSLFNNAQHYVIGLSCRANLLSERNIADKFNRGLYLFVGYVAKNPAFIPMQADLFESLYGFVHQKWEDDTIDARTIIKSKYDDKEIDLPTPPQGVEKISPFDINHDADKVRIHSNRRNPELWTIFSQYSRAASLCLNVAGQKDAKEGVFLNVSTVDYQGETPYIEISRIPPKPQTPPEPQTSTESVQSKDAERHPATTHSESNNFLEKCGDSFKQILKGVLFDIPVLVLKTGGGIVDKGVRMFTGEINDEKTVPTPQGNSLHKSDAMKTDDFVKPMGENKEKEPPSGFKYKD